MKRALDIVVASLLLVITAPVLIAAALAVLLTSGRPVLFGHRRIGRYGVPFRCWKLRTMQPDAERTLRSSPWLHEIYLAHDYKVPHALDPRLAPVGAFLRRAYLDELPQLFNVLNGTMSLVGPRPIVEEEVLLYGASAHVLLRERPGVFGAWAARGRARPGYPQRMSVELDYVRGRSLLQDLLILTRCVPVVLQGQAPE